jgi:hypothetical protein
MQTPGLNQSATRAGTARRARGLVLLGAGTLALVLAATGIAAALTGRFSPATQAQQPPATLVGSSGTSTATQPSSSLRPVAPVLADGIYPTYIDQVDVRGAKMTLDLVQVFYDDAAATAAIEDGHSDADAVMGWYVYIRNQNSKLRTLPVARDLNIQFVDGCETPPGRKAALTELAKQTTPFNDLYFYEVTVKDGAIHRITQKLARAAC